MISDRALVLAAAATYDVANTPLIESLQRSVRVFWSKVDGLTVIAIEGTHDPLGWMLDFLAMRTEDHQTLDHPSLGFLHAGFHLAALSIFARIKAMTEGQDYALAGHSLGAALALLIGGLMIDDGHPPVKIGAFAPPRVGGVRFVEVVTSVPLCAYWFGNDPVPRAPLRIWPGYPYEQVPLISIGPPHDIFHMRASDHPVANYLAGIPVLAAVG